MLKIRFKEKQCVFYLWWLLWSWPLYITTTAKILISTLRPYFIPKAPHPEGAPAQQKPGRRNKI